MANGLYRAPIGIGIPWWAMVAGLPALANGGKIATYAAGTLNPQPTFADGVTVPPVANTNPIVLNANGFLNAVDIWLSAGVLYKFVITDAAGNPIGTVDNIAGVDDPNFGGAFSEWIAGPAATWTSAATFTLLGDQTPNFKANRRIKIVSGAGTSYGTVQIATFGGITTVVTFSQNPGDGPAPTNPIAGLFYGLLDPANPSLTEASFGLGQPRFPPGGSGRTGTDLFGPIGSNLQVFTAPPVVAASAAGAGVVVASAGGAGNQIQSGTVKGIAASLEFNKTAHGFTDGQLVQVATSNTLPTGVAALTGYFILFVDANNFGLALTLGGAPIAWTNAGVGNQTVATPAQVVTGTVNAVVGSLTFYQPNHGLRSGEAMRVATSGALPTNVVAATTYIVFRVDANNFGLYAVPAGWIYEVPLLDPAANPGGLAWGVPLAFGAAGNGNQTVTPGWVAPPGVTRDEEEILGGGGGGGSTRASGVGSFGYGGAGGAGGFQKGLAVVVPGTFYPAIVGAGGLGGVAGQNPGAGGGNSSFNGAVSNGGPGGPAPTAVGAPGGNTNAARAISVQGAGSGAAEIAGGVVGAPLLPGASSIYGGGAPPNNVDAPAPGQDATGFGSGGGGGSSFNSATITTSGGKGSSGLITVRW